MIRANPQDVILYTPDQVIIIIIRLLYAFFRPYSDFIYCVGL